MTRRPADSDPRTVFLVDGWTSFRRSLRLFLEASGHRIAGEADTVHRAAEMDTLRGADIVVVEPRLDWLGLEGDLASLRRAAPAAAVVLLGSEPVPAQVVLRAIRSGVSAYLTKEDHPAELLRAIEGALSKEFVMLPRQAVADLVSITGLPMKAAAIGHPQLTRRELEILSLAAASHSNPQIARLLWVADQTVRFHLSSIYQKLGVKSRADAIAAARSLGMVGWEDGRAA